MHLAEAGFFRAVQKDVPNQNLRDLGEHLANAINQKYRDSFLEATSYTCTNSFRDTKMPIIEIKFSSPPYKNQGMDEHLKEYDEARTTYFGAISQVYNSKEVLQFNPTGSIEHTGPNDLPFYNEPVSYNSPYGFAILGSKLAKMPTPENPTFRFCIFPKDAEKMISDLTGKEYVMPRGIIESIQNYISGEPEKKKLMTLQ